MSLVHSLFRRHVAEDILCDDHGLNASLIPRGQGLISVDSKACSRDVAVPLQRGAEITFVHLDGSAILRLRFVPSEPPAPTSPPAPMSPPPARGVRRLEEEAQSPRSPWILSCIHVEGLSTSQLAELRSQTRDIQLSQFPMSIGRALPKRLLSFNLFVRFAPVAVRSFGEGGRAAQASHLYLTHTRLGGSRGAGT